MNVKMEELWVVVRVGTFPNVFVEVNLHPSGPYGFCVGVGFALIFLKIFPEPAAPGEKVLCIHG